MKTTSEQHQKRVHEIISVLKRPCTSKMDRREFMFRWIVIIAGTALGLWTYFYN